MSAVVPSDRVEAGTGAVIPSDSNGPGPEASAAPADPSSHTEMDDTYFMCLAARELAHDRNVAAIDIFTKSGRTALMLSKIRPAVPILAFTPIPKTYTRLNLYWGVKAHLVPEANTIEDMLETVEAAILKTGRVQAGQQVVLVCGFPISEPRASNMALLHTVGSNNRVP